uniref:hypothetical protein n=1 Tax=Carnobacterium TaxID=2747 RepID=UPI00344DAF88
MIDKEKAMKNALKFGAFATMNPISAALLKGSDFLTEQVKEVSKNGTVEDLNEVTKKQALEYKGLELNAKLAQEYAISQRIATAEEVVIEEYYEGEGSGSLGLNIKEGEASLGAFGSGRKVSKRIYRFIGINSVSTEIEDTNNQIV